MSEPGFAAPARREADLSLGSATVAVVGLGLMGGSLALALARSGACRRVVGVARSADTRAAALAGGAVAEASASLDLVADADAIVLATPVRTILDLIPAVGRIAKPGAIVMDLGSTKREVIAALGALPDHLQPLGAHPMCGKETSGFASADPDLYRGAAFVLTPLDRTSAGTLAFGVALAGAVGARPIQIDPIHHDRLVALISHLPYVTACSLALAVEETASEAERELLFGLAAGGFRDTTRVAAKDPAMMLDILMTNRDNVAASARACARRLVEFADLLERGDERGIGELQSVAATARRALPPRGGPVNG